MGRRLALLAVAQEFLVYLLAGADAGVGDGDVSCARVQGC
jgi:hypothetical protein